MFRKALLIVLLLSACRVDAEQVKVVDGDSLIVDGQMTRLIGIDSPEYKQKCNTINGRKYACGLEAKAYMEELISKGLENGEHLSCQSRGKDKYDRDLAVCYMGQTDLNREMVRQGWAVAYMHDWYESDQLEAKNNKRGIWQGKFMRPELYRILKKRQKTQNKRNSY